MKRRGFTLIELLVVVAIIVALLAILLPSMNKAVAVAQRALCASNARSLVQISMNYAAESFGRLPDLHNQSGTFSSLPGFVGPNPPNAFPYWFPKSVRDMLVSKHGVSVDLAYCPSNPNWSPGVFWDSFDPVSSVWGYMYFVGGESYANPASTSPAWTNLPAGDRVFAVRLSDNPIYKVAVTDLHRSINSVLGGGGNHFKGSVDAAGLVPAGTEGTNIGYLDAHVEWSPQSAMRQRGTIMWSAAQYGLIW